METMQLTATNIRQAAAKAAAVLRVGGVVLYPTDTLYGLGADAFSDEAVAKVYAMKDRDERKPIHCVVADLAMVQVYAEVNDVARKLAERLLPGPLTLVLRKKPGISSGIAKHIDTLGIRIPANDFCLALAAEFGPYTTTSANRAGAESARTVGDILAQLGLPAQAGERASAISLAVDAGELPPKEPSTVVDVSSGEANILREGAISSETIRQIAGF